MSNLELRFVIIKVKNLDRAKNFYIKLTGDNPFKEEADRMVEFRFGNVRLGLYNPLADGSAVNESDFGSNCMPSFGVDDLKSELDRISKFAKITSHGKVGNHEWFEFKDSEGNTLEIHRK